VALVSDVAHGPSATGHVTVSLCILVHDRPAELAEALRSGDDQPWDEVVVLDMASDPAVQPRPGVRWLRSDSNVGVTAGRNRLAEEATGDILVFLDDDAVFVTPVVERLRRAFGADETLGAVAFRIRRAAGAAVSLEHPFRGPGPESARATASECTYFVGCGYAMRRHAHHTAGGYDDRFFYSTEEVDLSFRLLRDG